MFFPALADESNPGLVCLRVKFSSANFSPENRTDPVMRVHEQRWDGIRGARGSEERSQFRVKLWGKIGDERTVDGLSTSSVSTGEISSLEHDWNNKSR